MGYFNSRELAAAALFSSLWGVLNGIFSPIVFRMFGLPILCDMIGFAALGLTFWWVRKFGAVTVVGIVATIVNFLFNPGGVFFLGFTAASFSYDLIASLIMGNGMFKKRLVTAISLVSISVASAAVAGIIIGNYFMTTQALGPWGGVSGWATLHAFGGLVGGLIGVSVVSGLSTRNIQNGRLGTLDEQRSVWKTRT
jgi:hypothetical protein